MDDNVGAKNTLGRVPPCTEFTEQAFIPKGFFSALLFLLVFCFQPFCVFVCADSQEQDAVQSRGLYQDPEDSAHVALQEETQAPVSLHPVSPPSPDTGMVVVVVV